MQYNRVDIYMYLEAGSWKLLFQALRLALLL